MQIFTRIFLNCLIRYDSTQISLRQSKYNGVDFLPIDLYLPNGEVAKMTWPEVTDIKIRDIRFVGTDDLIIFRKFHNFPWNIVAVVRLESYFVVGSLDLTWWPDFTWPCVEIFTKVAGNMGVRWVKTRRRCTPPYFRYPRKTWGGGGAFKRPPPRAGRGLINTCWRWTIIIL